MNRRGFALPLVLLTLALMGALAGGVVLLSRLRWHSGQRALETLQAGTLAESEVDRVLASWDPLLADTLLVGAVAAMPAGGSGPGLTAFDSLMRLGHGLYLVHSVGVRITADGAPLARAGIAELVRLLAPTLPDSMAVAAAGPVDVTGAGAVDGTDHMPAGWTGWCAAPAAAGLGIVAGPSAPVRALCSAGPCIVGAPAIGLDSALSPAALGQFGAVSLTDLLLAADHRVGGTISGLRPLVTAGACVQGDSLNWGDPASPSSPCGGFFPVIVAAPGTRVVSGQGQGLLLAAGALELAGDAAFTGVILASGSMTLRDQARVTGLVMTRDSLLLAGSGIIERSRCATARVTRGAARPGIHVNRGWFRWD